MPINAQIIHDGKYDPRMFLDGAELHPLKNVSAIAVDARLRSLLLTPVGLRRNARIHCNPFM
jgi:hypothetical protein